jgi:glycosyltransferase involved in cell wall biosynthesis
MRPLITALVDTYNQERYIEQALVSVIEQGLSPSELEIVVVDDGSTDATPSIIQKFAPRVRHVRKKNGGQASAFNAGFREARGEFVAILDGDDWWVKGKIAAVLDNFERNPADAAVSHAFYEVHDKENETRFCGPLKMEVLHLNTREAARLAREHWHFIQPSALTVRRKVLERVTPIPEALFFSADGPIATASMALGVRVLAQPLSYYRYHSGNLNAIGEQDMTKMRRRLEMGTRMADACYPMLIGMGVSPECVAELLDPLFIYANRTLLRSFGGTRLKTFRTEMRIFRSEFKNPRIGHLLFKHLVVGAATLLLTPRKFYSLRDWYGRRNLGRFTDWLRRGDEAHTKSAVDRAEPF